MRGKAKSRLWFRMCLGRITASSFEVAYSTNPWVTIVQPHHVNLSPWNKVQNGFEHEEMARSKYKRIMSHVHRDFEVYDCFFRPILHWCDSRWCCHMFMLLQGNLWNQGNNIINWIFTVINFIILHSAHVVTKSRWYQLSSLEDPNFCLERLPKGDYTPRHNNQGILDKQCEEGEMVGCDN